MNYSIWLEFEEHAESDGTDKEEEYGNIVVTYEDGRQQGFNVWTVDFFRRSMQTILDDTAEKGFFVMPDFLVTRFDREHITEALKQILPH